MVIFQRRDIIVANGELCLCINLVAIENKKYNLQLDYQLIYDIIEIINPIITKFPLNNAFQ